MIKFSVALLLCSIYVHVQAQEGQLFTPPPDADGKQFALNRQGESGNLQLCEGNDCQQTGQHINFRLSRLIEVDANKNEIPNRFVDLEPIQFAWSQPTQIAMKDTDGATFNPTMLQIVQNVSLQGTSSNNIVLNFTALFMPRQVTMLMHPKGNLTVDVPSRSLKFYLGVLNWPFLSTSNSLRFVGKVKCKPRGGPEHPPPQSDGEDKPVGSPAPGGKLLPARERRFKLNDGGDQFLDSPKAVMIDGVIMDNVVQFGQNPHSNEMAFIWTFPYFKYSLSYDPTLGMGSSSSSGSTTSASRSVSPNSPVLFAVLALSVFLLT